MCLDPVSLFLSKYLSSKMCQISLKENRIHGSGSDCSGKIFKFAGGR